MLFSAALLGVFSLLAHGLTQEIPPVKVFYVKATVSSTTECPSGDSPCHSLQYYANHSNFTNNSRFLFLEGGHHLDSVVTISNVANLSLVGLSSGVEILCKSVPSGFHVKTFVRLNIEMMAITNCIGSENISLSLWNGLDTSLNDVTISGNDTIGLAATNVVGMFSIFSSTFKGIDSNIMVNYSLCNRPSYLNFSKNRIQDTELHIGIYCSDVKVLIDDSQLQHGGLQIDYYVLTDNSVVVSNTTSIGGGLYIEMCVFDCKDSNLHCGIDFLKLMKNTFKNSSSSFIAPMADKKNCTVTIEDSDFLNESLINYHSSKSNNDTTINVIFQNTNIFSSSLNLLGAAALFVNSTFENSTNSAIDAQQSKVIFQGNNIFRNNSAPVGAGISLTEDSYMYLHPHTHILFEGNHADYVGGAIYTLETCFYHVVDSSRSNNTVQINFVENTAQFGGSSIYGDVLSCGGDDRLNFHNTFNISNTETDPSAIAFDPQHVCFCDDNKFQPNCTNSKNAYSTQAYPGQVFPVRLAVVGGRFDGVLPRTVVAFFYNPANATIAPMFQTSGVPFCVNLNYSVNSTEKNVTFELTTEGDFFELGSNYKNIEVSVQLLDCPLGFSLTGSCVCDSRLKNSNVECNINNQSFLRPASSWIGFINVSSAASSKPGVMFHPNCPIGYCLPQDVSVTSNTSDSQCEPRRTGLLCGKCKEGYSLTLGNQKCRKCSNAYLFLILPFAVAGLFLVAVLFALNLTVTEGSINGIVFYANVMALNHTMLFSGGTSYPYTFLAWLNLDLGISTCLFGGMDGYAETWLQLVFPVYLWVIILMVVLFYNKFDANRLGGKNAVQVLATLLLLSYTKLQRTVVSILSFTSLEYPDSVVRYVWLYDANVEFFKGKHLYLGIAGILVLIFLIVPYTLCLAFFQQLQACSGHRLFQWVNKLKPVFDAYAGPYKDKYRFWTGMLLIVRTLLIILFTINTAGSIEINLLIILVVSCILLLANSNGVYKKWPYNFFESFFYLQLVVFAGAAFYTRSTNINGGITAIADTSIGLSLTVFLAVVGCHVFCRISSLKRAHHYRLKGYVNVEEYVHDRVHDGSTAEW